MLNLFDLKSCESSRETHAWPKSPEIYMNVLVVFVAAGNDWNDDVLLGTTEKLCIEQEENFNANCSVFL